MTAERSEIEVEFIDRIRFHRVGSGRKSFNEPFLDDSG